MPLLERKIEKFKKTPPYLDENVQLEVTRKNNRMIIQIKKVCESLDQTTKKIKLEDENYLNKLEGKGERKGEGKR